MKITEVLTNNRRKAFQVRTRGKEFLFPYAATSPSPTRADRVLEAYVDKEMGREGFVYTLASGGKGAVHIDHVLDYNKDPGYKADMVLYKLTIWAQEAIEKTNLSTRELIRRLDTSPAQFYRLLDQTNYRKSVRQLLTLLQILDCEVTVVREEPLSTSREGEDRRKKIPLHPGEFLQKEFLDPLGLSQNKLAKALCVPARRINEIVRGKRGVTADSALRLARYFGRSAQFWLGLQMDYELDNVQDADESEIQAEVTPLSSIG